MRVELRVDTITVEQQRMSTIIERQTDLLAQIATQIATGQANTNALIDRTNKHSDTIEHLQQQEVDAGKLLEQIKTQVNLIKGVGVAIGLYLLTYELSHFVK